MERPLKPYERLPGAIEYQGKNYALDLSYAAVFVAADVLDDTRMDPRTRVAVALDILVKDPHPVDDGLLEAVTGLLREDRPKPDGPKTMDIEQDWSYICAAFMQAYGIDLYADKKMHILKFRALLQAIPKSTKLAEIIGIRAAKIPAPNKYNREQIAELTRLKTLYALRGSTSLQDGFAKLFAFMEARAQPHA